MSTVQDQINDLEKLVDEAIHGPFSGWQDGLQVSIEAQQARRAIEALKAINRFRAKAARNDPEVNGVTQDDLAILDKFVGRIGIEVFHLTPDEIHPTT